MRIPNLVVYMLPCLFPFRIFPKSSSLCWRTRRPHSLRRGRELLSSPGVPDLLRFQRHRCTEVDDRPAYYHDLTTETRERCWSPRVLSFPLIYPALRKISEDLLLICSVIGVAWGYPHQFRCCLHCPGVVEGHQRLFLREVTLLPLFTNSSLSRKSFTNATFVKVGCFRFTLGFVSYLGIFGSRILFRPYPSFRHCSGGGIRL